MTTIYDRLNPLSNDIQGQIVNFDKSITDSLNVVPTLLTTWQKDDIGANTVGGYFTNPLAPVCNGIISSATSLVNSTTGCPALTTMLAAAQILSTNSTEFRAHTYRISGVVEPTPSTAYKPHYSTAISMSKSIMMITHQTDNISNNSPILGHFSSLFIGSALNSANSTLASDAATVAASISGTSPSKTTSLSAAQISAITADIIAATSTMDTPRIRDENYYKESALVLNDFNTVRYFTSIGETEKNLIKNHIGSSKILQRLNL